MKDMAIVYSSYHHGNTKKILDEMAKVSDIDLISVEEASDVDLSGYEYIGFASGIYAFKMCKKLTKFAENFPFDEKQKSFIIYTCGMDKKDFSKDFEKLLKNGKSQFIGTFRSLGYDTFGPLKLIGGINKNRPNEEDFQRAREFIKQIIGKRA